MVLVETSEVLQFREVVEPLGFSIDSAKLRRAGIQTAPFSRGVPLAAAPQGPHCRYKRLRKETPHARSAALKNTPPGCF